MRRPLEQRFRRQSDDVRDLFRLDINGAWLETYRPHRRIHPLRHELLRRRRDHLIFGADQVPGGMVFQAGTPSSAGKAREV